MELTVARYMQGSPTPYKMLERSLAFPCNRRAVLCPGVRYGLNIRTPNKKSNNSRRATRGRRRGTTNPSDVVVTASMDRPFPTPNKEVTLYLRYVGNAASAGSGNLSFIATNNPNGSTDWANAAALWDSYRVEEMAVEYHPILTLQQATSTNMGPCYVVFDPDTASTLGTSVTTYLDYQNCRIFDLDKAWTYHVKRLPRYASASTLTGAYTMYDDGYLDTATPVGIGSIQAFSSGNTVSTTFGQYIIHWKVRFVMRH